MPKLNRKQIKSQIRQAQASAKALRRQIREIRRHHRERLEEEDRQAFEDTTFEIARIQSRLERLRKEL